LQSALYISDVCLVILKHLSFSFVEKRAAQHVAGSIIFSTWFARTLSQFKYHVLSHPTGFFSSFATNIKHEKHLQHLQQQHQQQQQKQQNDGGGKRGVPGGSEELCDDLDIDINGLVSSASNNNTMSTSPAVAAASVAAYLQQQQQQQQTSTSTMGVYNRFANQVLDVIIYFSCIVSVVDTLGIGHFTFALKSLFGLGSFGTLVLSLASKDVAAEFVGGLMVQSSNFVDEGETVILQDGTRGCVAKIGWLHTYILLEDNDFVVRVPNSQISHQRIARLKREQRSTGGGGRGRARDGGNNNKRKLFYT
jgi:Mechanosensitive ion channel